jgi:hypothetical protein
VKTHRYFFRFGIFLYFFFALLFVVFQVLISVNVFSYRRQNNVTLLLHFSIKIKTNKQQLKKSEAKNKQKRYQNLKNNKQKSKKKIQKYTKPEKITMCFHLLKRPYKSIIFRDFFNYYIIIFSTMHTFFFAMLVQR